MDESKILPFPQEESIWEKIIITLYNKRKGLLTGLLCVLASIPLAIKYYPRSPLKYQEYIEIQKAYSDWENADILNEKLLDDLIGAIRKHPELGAKYGHRIHQKFITLSKENEFPKEIEGKSLLPNEHFNTFSLGSILVASLEYEKAATLARELDQKMLDDLTFKEMKGAQVLRAFNLLRLATLSKKLGHRSDELSYFRQLKHFLMNGEKVREELIPFVEHFSQNGITLFDYIKMRESTS